MELGDVRTGVIYGAAPRNGRGPRPVVVLQGARRSLYTLNAAGIQLAAPLDNRFGVEGPADAGVRRSTFATRSAPGGGRAVRANVHDIDTSCVSGSDASTNFRGSSAANAAVRFARSIVKVTLISQSS